MPSALSLGWTQPATLPRAYLYYPLSPMPTTPPPTRVMEGLLGSRHVLRRPLRHQAARCAWYGLLAAAAADDDPTRSRDRHAPPLSLSRLLLTALPRLQLSPASTATLTPNLPPFLGTSLCFSCPTCSWPPSLPLTFCPCIPAYLHTCIPAYFHTSARPPSICAASSNLLPSPASPPHPTHHTPLHPRAPTRPPDSPSVLPRRS